MNSRKTHFVFGNFYWVTENSTISRVDCGLDQDPDLIKKKLISFPGTLLLDFFFCESGQV